MQRMAETAGHTLRGGNGGQDTEMASPKRHGGSPNHLESHRLKALSASLRREQTMRVQAGAKTRHKVALAQKNIASTK